MKLIIVLMSTLLSGLVFAENTESIREARGNAALLGQSLQTELINAMKSGGPLAAINFCHIKAMPISQDISATTGWQVGRTSLRLRNVDNRPDGWEKKQLKLFEKRLAAGEPANELEVFEVQQKGDQQTERYMKAIVIAQPCLVCHGEALSTELSTQLYSLYPQDKARGYKLGELRGAFTLQRVSTAAN